MDQKLLITIGLLSFIIALAGVGAYIDILVEGKSKYIGYASLVTLMTVGLFTIVFLVLLGFCSLIKSFI